MTVENRFFSLASAVLEGNTAMERPPLQLLDFRQQEAGWQRRRNEYALDRAVMQFFAGT